MKHSHFPSDLLDARSVQADARQRGGGHGVGIQGDWVGSVRAVAVPQQQVLRPRVERRRHLQAEEVSETRVRRFLDPTYGTGYTSQREFAFLLLVRFRRCSLFAFGLCTRVSQNHQETKTACTKKLLCSDAVGTGTLIADRTQISRNRANYTNNKSSQHTSPISNDAPRYRPRGKSRNRAGWTGGTTPSRRR